MAPPKNYNEINPTVVPFEKVTRRTVDQNGKPVVVTDYRPARGSGFEILTDDVLNSGDLDLLYKFRTERQKELNSSKYAPAKRYLDARIKSAEKLQAYENRAKLFAAQRKAPPKPMVAESNGFIGLVNTKYSDYQTSANGCWSVAYSTLLKSRGVELSQEEIRRWRPDYKENTAPNQKANRDRKLLMNTDSGNSIYENADLVGKVLPNTAVGMLHLDPFNPGALTIGNQALNANQLQIVQEEYLAQMRERLQTTFTQALVEHQSPVAITVDGHYVTVTGLSLDGNTILYEESLGAETKAPRTRTMSMDSLVRQAALDHVKNGKRVPGTGIELAWLRDLPVSEVGRNQPALDAEQYVTADQNGTVTLRVPANHASLSAAGKPSDGQVRSRAVEQSLVLDQTRLAKRLGAKVEGWGVGGGIMFGNAGTSYPGRVLHPGDPKLVAEALNAQADAFTKVRAGLDSFALSSATEAEKARAAEFRGALDAFRDAAAGKAVDLDRARASLAGMYDFLLGRAQGSNRTRFEIGCHGMRREARRDFVEKLHSLNDSLGLGKEQASLRLEKLHATVKVEPRKSQKQASAEGPRPAAKAEPRETQKQASAEARYRRNMSELWETVQKNAAFRSAAGSPQQAELHFSLALIAANYFAYQRNLRMHKEPPFPNDTEVAGYLERVQKSEAFRRTLAGKMPWLGDKSKYPTDFVKDFLTIDKQVADERLQRQEEPQPYAIPKAGWQQRRQRLLQIAALLKHTGTGSYTGLDLVSRDKNSTSFDLARDAISKTALTSEKAPPSPDEVRTSVETVLAYLDGKEKRRTREFGRDRWTGCMRFLAETMPRGKFEAYCAHVNQVRGVKPGHPDYVSPETLYSSVANLKSVTDDSISRIVSGQNTLRDYARVIAAGRLGMRPNGAYQEFESVKNDKLRTQLCVETEKVLGDRRFASFVAGSDKQSLLRLMTNGAAGFNQVWEGYKQQHPNLGQPTANQPQTAQQPQLGH